LRGSGLENMAFSPVGEAIGPRGMIGGDARDGDAFGKKARKKRGEGAPMFTIGKD